VILAEYDLAMYLGAPLVESVNSNPTPVAGQSTQTWTVDLIGQFLMLYYTDVDTGQQTPYPSTVVLNDGNGQPVQAQPTITAQTDSDITLSVPAALTAGSYSLVVTTSIGWTASTNFVVSAMPQISDIVPSPWPVGPATQVTISGAGFSANPNVLLDDPNATLTACGTAGVECSAACPAGATPDTCFSVLVTVNPATVLGGTHVTVRAASGIQSLPVSVNYEFASATFSRPALWQLIMTGSPTPAGGWVGVVSQGEYGAPTVTYPDPPDPATQVMNFLAPDSQGLVSPGGMINFSEQYYTASGMYSASIPFYVVTFGMSCYGYANEPDWGTPPNNCATQSWYGVQYSGSVPAPPGTLPQRSYCSSFLEDLYVQGSGYLADGTKAKYQGGGVYEVLPAGQDFTTSDGTPLTPWLTVARDPAIIQGKGNLVDLDTIGNGLEADDTGGDIVGYRLDMFGGLDTACQGYANPIVVGACLPGDPSGLTCPPLLPQPPALPCPAN
jgi:3D (Asp-Asp-Asp) domain-containing protein